MDTSSSSTALSCLLLLLLLCSCESVAASLLLPLCYRRTLTDIASLQRVQCSLNENADDRASRVIQVNGLDIDKALRTYEKGRFHHAAVLFYTDWCPFSRILLEMFESLSTAFPEVYHLAVESSSLWPSALSQHGVYSFPALFVHNATQKVTFRGSRSMESLSQFYTKHTGLLPMSSNETIKGVVNLSCSGWSWKENWWNQLMRSLANDTYLAFCVVFVTIRLLMLLLPKIVAQIRWYWSLKETSRQAQMALRRSESVKEPRQVVSLSVNLDKGKNIRKEGEREAGKGVLSVPSWPTAVALAESSSRGVATEDANERSSLWG